MSEIQKPTTMLMDEFKEKFVDLLNNSQLPAWVLLYLLDPFIKQLEELTIQVQEQEKQEYQMQLSKSENKE